jgi:hypothetical protein
MTKRIYSTTLIAALGILAAIPALAQSDPDGRVPGALGWGRLKIGDVIATGQRTQKDAPCYFTNVPFISIPAAKGRSRSIRVQVNENCQAVVAGRSDTLKYNLIRPLVAGEDTIDQFIVMYGAAGYADPLTTKTNYFTWSWDGSSAYVVGASDYCAGASHPPLTWVVDYCNDVGDASVGGYGQAAY